MQTRPLSHHLKKYKKDLESEYLETTSVQVLGMTAAAVLLDWVDSHLTHMQLIYLLAYPEFQFTQTISELIYQLNR